MTWLLCREASPDTKQYYQELFKLVELLGNRVNYLQNHDEDNASLPSLMRYLMELCTELSSFIKNRGKANTHQNCPTTESTHEIHFYSTKTAYGFLSNFYKAPFTLDYKSWQTVEHYFQAKKFEGSEYEEAIRDTSTATEAAKLGRNRKIPIRRDWKEVKEAIMLQALSAKFTQNMQLKDELLQTGNATLIERTAKDRYWGDGGDGGDGSGENRLGILLMQVRDQLSNGL